MTVFTTIRNSIADSLDEAAGLIGHYGLSTGRPFDTSYGVDLRQAIADGTPVRLSSIGALVLTANPAAGGYELPSKNWDASDYPAVKIFAQYLVDQGQMYEPLDNPAATVEFWTSSDGRTEEQVVQALHDAATAVQKAAPGSKLLAVISS